LHDLRLALPDDAGGVPVHDGVLDGDARDGRVEHLAEEHRGLDHALPAVGLGCQPADPGVTEVGAGGVEDGEVPAIVEDVPDVALVVRSGDRGGE
jgi:hypothetical protein